MSDDQDRPHDTDPGEPLAELADLRDTPTDAFGQRVRNSIWRRVTVADTLDFSLTAMFRALFGYVEMACEAWGAPTTDRRDRD